MADRYWRGGTGTWNGTSTTNWSTTSGGSGGASVPTSSDNVIFDANSNTGTGNFTVTMATVTAVCADFTATAVDGTMTLAGTVGITIYGSLALPATRFTRSYTGTTTFAATSTGKTINLNGKGFGANVTFDGVGGGWTLFNALTTSSTFTLNNGSLDLGGFTVTAFGFASFGSNARTLAFNGGSISITGNSNTSNQTLWNAPTITNLTVTGTPTVNVPNTSTNSGFTRTFSHGNTAGGAEANAITLNVQAGNSGNLTAVTGHYLDLNFNGCSSTLNNSSRFIYGNLTLSFTMSTTGGTSVTNFASTSATVRTVNTAGLTLDFPFLFAGTGSYQLLSQLTLGSTRSLTIQSGTFDSNNYNITCGTFNYNNSNTKSITLGTSTVTINGGTSTTGFVGTSSNTTYSMLNATVVFTNTGAFSNGSTISGNQIGAVVMVASGGTLYLGNSSATGARCTTLGNTPGQPCTITNTCTTAFVVTNFAVSGSLGNVVTINSDIAGTARTISQSSGTIDAAYLTIQDSTVSGGATWNAYASTNTSNNTGWNFVTAKTTAVYTATGTFTVPSGVTSITVEAIGGGGNSVANVGFGAGGGAYAKSNAIAVTPGSTFYVNIGTAADSWANTSNSAPVVGVTPTTQAVLAKAGASGSSTGLGGQASLSLGDVKYSGGNGGTSQRVDAFSYYGLGGSGGAAGPYGAGGNGGDALTSVSVNPGGGGGGAGSFSSSGGGGAGYVPINTYTGGNGGSSAAGLLGGAGVDSSAGQDGLDGGGGAGGGYDIGAPLAKNGGNGSVAVVPLWSFGGTSYGPGSGAGGGSALGTVDYASAGTGGSFGGGGDSGTSGLVIITYVTGGSSIDVSITEAASGIDSILARIIAASAINENAAGLDSLTTQLVITGAISEAASGLDALTTTATLNLAIAEGASGLDAVLATATLAVAIAEAASGLDSAATSLLITLSIFEAASGVDSSSAGIVFAASILEAVSGQDTLATQLQAVSSILEAAAGVDAVPVSAILNIAVVESATGVAVSDASFLWNPIDDTQTANWSPINDSQTTTWLSVNTVQTVTWVPVNTNPNAT